MCICVGMLSLSMLFLSEFLLVLVWNWVWVWAWVCACRDNDLIILSNPIPIKKNKKKTRSLPGQRKASARPNPQVPPDEATRASCTREERSQVNLTKGRRKLDRRGFGHQWVISSMFITFSRLESKQYSNISPNHWRLERVIANKVVNLPNLEERCKL